MQNKWFKWLTISCLVVDIFAVALFVVGVVLLLLNKLVFSKTILAIFFCIIGLNILYIAYLVVSLILNRKKKSTNQNI